MAKLVLAILALAVNPAWAGVLVTVYPENQNQEFGKEIAWLGDVNADTYDDFLVVDEEQEGPGYLGRAYVYFGGSYLDDVADLVLQQDDSGSITEALEGPFDFNGDGFGDIAISSPSYDTNDMSNTGAVFIYHGGADIDAIADFMIPGPWTSYYFGKQLAKAGHFNTEDEYDDIAITIDTSYGWGPLPTVYAYFGGPNPTTEYGWLRSYTGDYYDGFEKHLEFAGDLNGDGAGDLVIGVPWRSGFCLEDGALIEGWNAGGVLRIHGGDYMWHAGTMFWLPIECESHLGYEVDGAFDFNGDRLDDVIAAAPNVQESKIVFGSTDIHANDSMTFVPGEDVAGLGDVNGDGFDDIAIVDTSCAVWIFWGGADPDSIPDQVIRPVDDEDWDSVHVGRAGDIDNDGLDDVMVHIRTGQGHTEHFDRVRIYSGLSGVVGIDVIPPAVTPLIYRGSTPNPSNPLINIAFTNLVDAQIQIRLFDPSGRLVRSVADRYFLSGDHEVQWNGKDDRSRNMPSGTYLVQIIGMGRAVSGKISLLR